jgi:hypothetical protein
VGRRNAFDANTFTAESQSNLMHGMNLFLVYFYDDQGFEVGTPSFIEMSQPTGLNNFYQPGMKVRGSFILYYATSGLDQGGLRVLSCCRVTQYYRSLYPKLNFL